MSLVGFAEDKVENNVPIGTAVTAVDLPDRTALVLQVNEGLILTGNNNSLLSCNQVRDYGVVINDVPKRFGGTQNLQVDGDVVPFELKQALLTCNTDQELHNTPMIILFSDKEWDPDLLTDGPLSPDQVEKNEKYFYRK